MPRKNKDGEFEGEFFYVDENGNWSDAEMHKDADDPELDLFCRQQSARLCVMDGTFTEEEAKELYRLDEIPPPEELGLD
jgi:hypothetical protein